MQNNHRCRACRALRTEWRATSPAALAARPIRRVGPNTCLNTVRSLESPAAIGNSTWGRAIALGLQIVSPHWLVLCAAAGKRVGENLAPAISPPNFGGERAAPATGESATPVVYDFSTRFSGAKLSATAAVASSAPAARRTADARTAACASASASERPASSRAPRTTVRRVAVGAGDGAAVGAAVDGAAVGFAVGDRVGGGAVGRGVGPDASAGSEKPST